MSVPNLPFTIPAGEGQEFILTASVFRLDTFPSGLLLGINGGREIARSEGFLFRGEVTRLRVENPTGGALTGSLSYGMGDIDLPGVTSLVGTIALPSGASTAALQTTGNASLASMDGKLPSLSGGKVPVTDPTALPLPSGAATAANQSTANGYLATLATPTARAVRVIAFNAGGDVVVSGARSLDILNTHTSLSVTISGSGFSTFTLGPGQGISWPLLNPRETSYQNVTITTPASGTGTISYVV
jgi:hypothetical protein